MVNPCFRILAVCTLLLLITAAAQPAAAHFDRIYTSARMIALAGAFTAVADDPSSMLSNPGGLTSVPGYSFASTLMRPYGIDDLEESFFAAVAPVGFGTAGVSWHRLALNGVATEDLISIGFGRDYIRTSQDASLSFGGTLDIARVAFHDRIDDSRTVVTGSLGILLRPFPIIGMGYCVRNLVPRTFAFLDADEGGTDLTRTHVWSLAYHWDGKVSLVFDRGRDQRGKWRNRVGIEIAALPALELRSGVNEDGVSGGMGLHLSGIRVDIGVSSHEELGVSYVLSVGYTVWPRTGGDDEGN